MSDESESLKRVLLHIKGAARGFKKGRLESRLKPEAPEPEEALSPLTLDPASPEASDDAIGNKGPDSNTSTEVAMGENDGLNEADKLKAAIRKLIGSV